MTAATTSESFGMQTHESPPERSLEFIHNEWDVIRDSGITPRYQSTLNDSTELRLEFLAGAEAMGLVGARKALKPQQLRLADTLNTGAKFNAVLMPRRSSKTTTLLAWFIGRCLSREEYMVAFTLMTTGKKARDRFLKDIVPVITRRFLDPKSAPFVIRKGAGQERIEFRNGSIFQILAPIGDDFRSEAYDVIGLDEGGEAEVENTEDVLGAALPTMDTRPGAMLVAAGTAAKFRDGNLLWDELTKARDGKANYGGLDYSAPLETKLREGMTWAEVEPLVLESHPGVGNLTPLDAIRDNFERLKLDQFGREYLGLFGKVGVSSLFDHEAFAALGVEEMPAGPPARFALAFSVHKLQTSASIMAVWRDKEGRAHLLELAHRKGVAWLYPALVKLARKHGVSITVDNGNAVNATVVEKLKRARPVVKLDLATWPQVASAAAGMLSEIESGTIVHYRQVALVEAVEKAKRGITPETKQWSFRRAAEEDDITALEAASIALRAFDNLPKRRAPLKIVA